MEHTQGWQKDRTFSWDDASSLSFESCGDERKLKTKFELKPLVDFGQFLSLSFSLSVHCKLVDEFRAVFAQMRGPQN